MKRRSYIGITGFISPDEITETLRGIDMRNTNRLLMVGVLASSRTIRGIPNKWPTRYPPPEKIKTIFSVHPQCLNLLHYNTKEPETLLMQLIGITNQLGNVLHGFQLNVPWPEPSVLAAYRSYYPDKCIVLQIGPQAFEEVGNNPKILAQQVGEYQGGADYILLDPSGGLGQPFISQMIERHLSELTEKWGSQFGFAVAGGLSPTTIYSIATLIKKFPDLSIDAEGRLRRPSDDALDVDAARTYFQKALQVISSPPVVLH